MTVAQLIDRLRHLQQDLTVVRMDGETGVDRDVIGIHVGAHVTPYGTDESTRVVRIR